MPGVLADRVTYATAEGMIVPAIVYRPDPKTVKWKGKLPGIVVVNGHGGDKFAWYAFYSGMLFAKAGAVVVTYDPIGEGERNIDKKSRAGSHDKWIDPPAALPRTDWGQRLAGLMQVDVMQAVSYLAARPEVDPSRIATVGYSMGSFVTGITGAIDTRIHAVLLSGGGDFDGPGGYFDSNPLPCQSPPYRSLQVLGDRGAILYALECSTRPHVRDERSGRHRDGHPAPRRQHGSQGFVSEPSLYSEPTKTCSPQSSIPASITEPRGSIATASSGSTSNSTSPTGAQVRLPPCR